MKTEKKKQQNRSFKKVAKLIAATAGVTPLALAVPALSEAQSVAAGPVVKKHIKDVIAKQESAGKIRAGGNITVELNDIFEEAEHLTYTVVIQNTSVADVTLRSSLLLDLRFKKPGTTMVNVSAKKPNESIAVHERFQLTVGANAELDLNGDGAGIDDVVKFFKAHPDDLHSIDDYRNVLGAAVESTIAEPNRTPVSKGTVSNINVGVGSQTVLYMHDYFSDEDGDALTYTLQPLPVAAAVGAALDSGSGLLTITGLYASAQPLLLTVEASDGQPGHSPVTQLFSVVPVSKANNAPLANNGTLSAVEDVTAAGTLSAADTDGDNLTYVMVSQGAKGSVTITDEKTGAYTYTPHPNAFGTDSFTFLVNDGDANSEPATVNVTITGVDDDPVLNPDYHVGLNNRGNINLGALQKAQIDLAQLFSDPDGDPLLFSTSFTNKNDLSGSLSPSGVLTLQAGFPSGAQPKSIELKASDDGGATWVAYNITATVLESRTYIPDQYIPVDPLMSYTISLSDYFDLTGNGKWSFSVVNKEGNGYASASVSGSTLTIKGLETGISTLIVTLDDGHDGKISDEFKIIVGLTVNNIGTQYMTSYDGIYTGMVYLNEIFPTATQFRVKDIGATALTTDPTMLDENEAPNWFTSPYLSLTSEMEVNTTVTVEAKNELGEIAEYTFQVQVKNAPNL
ncbi:cadherin-like domain-containing protein [Paenibacillus sp. sptzw28]|uniref:cadherin-like domain-containing protein n=1 Tax=Paenibacillus sp. sptzw28 TaxID=715179 RepID=UPI001C6E2F1E|nr:cadherin-like domain-containing protein [Paenibacillus sp. sptzw28]QYR20884.1 cadherin-like domain-containing protein [Paenibacillus sp. sptzw28]